MTKRYRILALVALLFAAAFSHADNWPRFRGPNGTGEANDKNIPITFNEKDNMIWKTALPGVGHSSPIVWGDSIFLESAATDAKERWLICVDANDGKIRWQTGYPGSKGRTDNKGSSQANSTPATDGERVYSLFWD